MGMRTKLASHRLDVWERITNLRKRDGGLVPLEPRARPITIRLADGAVREGMASQTTPFAVAKSISNSLAKSVLVASVNGNLWDLNVPLVDSCDLVLHKFDSDVGKHVFWHSSAHVLGAALERFYGPISLDDGPPLSPGHPSGGFFYDFKPPEGVTVSERDYEELVKIALEFAAKNSLFERMEVTQIEAEAMFALNPLKLTRIASIMRNKSTPVTLTAYKCGDFIDLCAGPHVPHTGHIRSMAIVAHSAAHWADESTQGTPPSLQRVYAISFPDPKQLNEWLKLREEAEKRDHRVVGTRQKLFMFSPMSVGSAFILSHGTRIYNRLMGYMRQKYHTEGYEEVITPLMFRNELWQQSGHWAHYKADMFTLAPCSEHGHEQDAMSLKPMNCPGHCLVFASMNPSYRDLPIKLADFSSLHRNEAAGALRGLTRLRRFTQDDAHIFCRPDQIGAAVSECLSFVKDVYTTLGFSYRVVLSTRPSKFMGDVADWDDAERALQVALRENGLEFTVNEGDGAFYGPKIDVLLRDAIKREHQCGTIQLDFQLPQRFELGYRTAEGALERPVIIHRAILGSLERMLAVLIEHTGGRWPFWLSPRQAIVCSVNTESEPFAKQVRDELHSAGYFVDVDLDANTVPKKVKNAQDQQYNFILVVGGAEVAAQKVNVRTRDGVVHGLKSVKELLDEFKNLTELKE